ncbi:MAG: hypothetical protein U1E65_05400 [Myxococcota bacterium]
MARQQLRAGVRMLPKLSVHAADEEGRRHLEAEFQALTLQSRNV